mgnify:CR=1 FL=1
MRNSGGGKPAAAICMLGEKMNLKDGHDRNEQYISLMALDFQGVYSLGKS